MNDNHEITHSFSHPIAKRLGVNAAIVLGYIGYKIERSTNIKDGKRWFYTTFDEMVEHYPYLSRTAIYNAVQRLAGEAGPLITGNHNKWKQDKTTWYAFKDERTSQQLQVEPRYFKSCNAATYGILEAVLINNIEYWINENRKTTSNYDFHSVSPLKLAEHIPFSRSAIQRALDNLVKQKMLISRKPTDKRKSTEYGLVTEFNGMGQCSNVNEIMSVPKNDLISTRNITSSNKNTAGPTKNIASPSKNIANPDKNDITTLIDTPLEDSCLKDLSLKEDNFKTPVSFCSQHTLSAEAVSQLTSLQNERRNDFSESIVPPIPDSLNSTNSNSTSNSVKAAPISVAPKSDIKLVASVKRDEPQIEFLDPIVHECCWDVMNQHFDNPDPSFENMAHCIVDCIEELVAKTEPEELFRLYKIKSQQELNAELAVWTSDYFARVYDSKYSQPELPNNKEFREMFINHAHCFLNMGFHWIKFEGRAVYYGKYYFPIGYAVFLKINSWSEKRLDEQRKEKIRKRTIQFASPDRAKENNAGLTAAEKMQVFHQSLLARNRIGFYDQSGHFSESVVMIQRRSLEYVRQLFQLNPSLTPAHLNTVLDECLSLPRLIDDDDPLWHAKNGYKISLFINNLATIASQLNVLSKLPAFIPLPLDETEESTN